MSSPRLLTLFGAIGLVIGAFMPWFSASAPLIGQSVLRTGVEGDGILCAGLGVILLLISVLHKGSPGKRYSWPAFISAILAGFIAVLSYNSYLGVLARAATGIYASIGPGIYLSFLGALLGAIGALLRVPSLESKSGQGPDPA